MTPEQRWLVVHWGSRGGGPAFSYHMAAGLATDSSIALYLSFSTYADNHPAMSALVPRANQFEIRTYRSSLGFLLGLPRLVQRSVAFRRWIRQNNITHVYSPMFSLWQSLALPIWLPRSATYVSSVHDAEEHPGDEHALKRLCYRMEASHATVVATYSSDVEKLVLNRRRPPVTVRVPHGVAAKTQEPRTRSVGEPITALFFGRILEYKGIDLFVDAVIQLREEGLPIQGQVWGESSTPEHLQALIAQSGDAIEWTTRWIAEEEVDGIFREADVVVLPYTEASQSGVLAQAAGYGVPAVVTPVGGLSEQATEYGNAIVVNSVSSNSVAAGIRDLYSDRTAYERLSSTGLRSAETQSSWSSVAHELTRQIRDLS